MSLANRITVGRAVASLALFALMMRLHATEPRLLPLTAAFFLFIAVSASDALDGYFARKYKEVSDFGRIADPAVDKVTVTGTLIFLCAAPWAHPVLQPWMVVLIVAREFIISGLRGFMESRGIDFSADWSGKLKMIVQCVAIPGVFFFKIIELWLRDVSWAVDGAYWLAVTLVWLAIGFTVWSGIEYVFKATRLLRAVSAPRATRVQDGAAR